MRRNRLFLCFLLGIAIVFVGVPYLKFEGELTTIVFSIAWLLFALIAISGNLIPLLYGGRVNRHKKGRQQIYTQTRQKVRQYG